MQNEIESKSILDYANYSHMYTSHTISSHCTKILPIKQNKKLLNCFTALYNINYLFYSYRKKNTTQIGNGQFFFSKLKKK